MSSLTYHQFVVIQEPDWHFSQLKSYNYSSWADLKRLLESLTVGPRPNRQAMRLHRMSADLIEEVCREPAPLIAYLRQVVARNAPSYELLHHRLAQFRRQAVRNYHPSLQQSLQEQLHDRQLGIDSLPSAEVVLQMGEQLGYMTMDLEALKTHYRLYALSSFVHHFDAEVHTLDFLQQQLPLALWLLQTSSDHSFLRSMIYQGADHSLYYLAYRADSRGLGQIYQAVIEAADVELLQGLHQSMAFRLRPRQIRSLGSLEVAHYLESQYLQLHQVSVGARMDRLLSAAVGADTQLLQYLLRLYPCDEACQRLLFEEILTSGSIACLEVWRRTFGIADHQLPITPFLLDMVVSENALQMALYLTELSLEHGRIMVEVGRYEGNKWLARLLARFRPELQWQADGTPVEDQQ